MTDPKPFPMIYFLIEETARELRSRVLLGTVAAERGLSTCIVPQWMAWTRFERLPRGIMVFKGNNSFQTSHMMAAHKAGHVVAAVEEEVLGVSDEKEIERLFDPKTVDACDLILAQGDHARDVVKDKYAALAERIIVTGNPRIDLLRAPFSADIMARGREIQRTQGNYVLINTNLASINPRIEDTCAYLDMCRQVGVIDPERTEDWTDFIDWCLWEHDNLDLLTKVIGALISRSDFPKLIIRPHPSENTAKWKEAYRDEERVAVILEGDHLPWTAGAELLIHTGCTTGMEAALLDIPSLSLQGGKSDWHGVHTSNHVNPTATSVEQAIYLIEKHLSGDRHSLQPTDGMREELKRHVLPWPDDLAAVKIVDALQQLAGRTLEGVDTGPRIANTRDHKYQVSEEKIIPSSFTVDAVSDTAAGFAVQLGHISPPSVTSSGDGIISILPSA